MPGTNVDLMNNGQVSGEFAQKIMSGVSTDRMRPFIAKDGKTFIIRKSRIESLPQNDSMPLSYEKFADVYGKDIIESESKPADLATEDQIKNILELVEALNINDDQIAKWFKKVDVDEWCEMTVTQILGLTDILKKKVESIKK